MPRFHANGPGNFRATYVPEEIDQGQREFLQTWVKDKFRLEPSDGGRGRLPVG
jgi:hypothetical protein